MFAKLISLLRNLFSGPATVPSAPAQLVRPPAAPRAASPRPAPAAPEPVRSAAVTVGLGARRPLVAASGALAGFEFHAPPAPRARPNDQLVQRARTDNVLGAMRLAIDQKQLALAELPLSWLAGANGDGAIVAGMYLVLGADHLLADRVATEALQQRLRAAGARLSWRPPLRDGDPTPPGRPDFVLLAAPDHPDADIAVWRQAVADAAQRWPGVPQVALDLPDIDLLEQLLVAPVTLAACAVGMNPAPGAARALPPQAHLLLRLLNRLVRDDDSTLVVSDIKSDAALSLRLLQLINSAGGGVARQLDSIEQAVMVLGRDSLYRWVAQMLVRMSPSRPAGEALQAQALARGRFLELLARAADEPNAGSLYLLGLASMLPMLLHCSVDEALASLQLPQPAVQALRDKSGPWLHYLAIMNALERHDMVAAEALAQAFGGIDTVLACSAQSWQFSPG